MAGEDIRKDLRELRQQIEALREVFDRVAQPYADLARSVEQLQDLSRRYLKFMDLIGRYGAVSPELAVPGLKDDISRHIVHVLVERGDRNISQITEAVKAKRGTASRRIVRERLADLERGGIVMASRASRNRTFRLSDDVIEKWSQVLGLAKYEDRTRTGQKEGGESDARGLDR